MSALLEATPNEQAYGVQKLFFEMLASAVSAVAAATVGGDWIEHAENGRAAVAALTGAGLRFDRVRHRCGACHLDTAAPTDGHRVCGCLATGGSLRSRAEEFAAAGEALSKVSLKATATGHI